MSGGPTGGAVSGSFIMCAAQGAWLSTLHAIVEAGSKQTGVYNDTWHHVDLSPASGGVHYHGDPSQTPFTRGRLPVAVGVKGSTPGGRGGREYLRSMSGQSEMQSRVPLVYPNIEYLGTPV